MIVSNAESICVIAVFANVREVMAKVLRLPVATYVVAEMLPISVVVPAIVKLLVDVISRLPRTTPLSPVNVISPLFPRDVWAVPFAEMVMFRPSVAVRVSFPDDTEAFTPVVLD